MKVHLYPEFAGPDRGDGGVRRVIEGQISVFGALGVDVVPRAEDADLIAAHIKIPHPYLQRFPRVPIVAHCHGLYWSEYEWPNWALKANAEVMELLRVADAITAPSEWVAQAIRRATARRVDVVPHGVDAEAWVPSDAPDDYVLWNKTRPDPVCDPEPVNMLARVMPDIRFLSTFGQTGISNLEVIGAAEPYEAAKERVLRAAVYLATSRETFGIGTLEAMAAGVPVVGWAWGAQTEFIEHGIDGWLATPGDFEALAEGVRWAFENRSGVGAAAQRKAREFTWERAGRMYRDVYERVLARANEPRPRVSVIVTAYKLDSYIRDCLDSVAAQTLRDIECVVVDDASPDDCGKIADAYAAKDSRFRVIHNAENQYLAGARNTGAAASRGDYVLPLDADDMLPAQACEILADALDKDRSIAIAYGNVEFVNENGDLEHYDDVRFGPGHSGWPMDFRFDWQMMQRNLLPYSSMYRRVVWEATCGYRTRFRTAEDADFWCRAASYGFRPKRVTSQDTLTYRNRPDSMSRVQPQRDWAAWFPWARDPALTPGGAAADGQLPISSADPPVVSVVIPVGPGHGRYALDAVDSVDAQTFRQWECIVVNDSGAPLPALPSWVRVVHPEIPQATMMAGALPRFGGVSAARNAGISVARARRYVALDADDMLQPAALATMFEAHQATDGAIVYSDFYEDPHREGEYSIWRTPDWDPRLLIQKGTIGACTQLIPVAVWRDVGGYDETIPAWEDWAFQIAAAEKGYCSVRVPLPLFTYRKHTGSRRRENADEFEQSKQGIITRFGQYWKGAELMACRSCSGKPRAYNVRGSGGGDDAPADASDAVLMRYEAPHSAHRTFRGASGTTYRFRPGETRYVLVGDVQSLLRLPGFSRAVEGPVAADAPVLAPSAPVEAQSGVAAPPRRVRRSTRATAPAQAASGADPVAAVALADEPPPVPGAAAPAEESVTLDVQPGDTLDDIVSRAPKKS